MHENRLFARSATPKEQDQILEKCVAECLAAIDQLAEELRKKLKEKGLEEEEVTKAVNEYVEKEKRILPDRLAEKILARSIQLGKPPVSTT